MKIINDQFYTKPEIAKICINLLKNFNHYTTWIEPAAGEGTFSKLDHKIIAYDIEPKFDNIIKQDFLKLKLDKNWSSDIIFLGNPPFGYRSTLAKQFIKKSIKLNAKIIAFILPDTFSKLSNQKVFPKNWKLITEFRLPKDSFYVYQDEIQESYHVPCSFYIWTCDEEINLTDLRKKIPINKPTEFKFLKRGDLSADFVINGNSGKIKQPKDVTNTKAEHYIKILDVVNFEILLNKFKNLKYDKLSSVNGGNYWINQTDIITAWFSGLNEEN